jgi:hypothetical protein
MSDPRESEALLVVAPALLAALGRSLSNVQVTQVLHPRLAIVRGDRPVLEALAAVDGVERVLFEDSGKPEGLDPREGLFVGAWLQGRQPKERPGDGLAWDVPGRLPPDRPLGRLPSQPPHAP